MRDERSIFPMPDLEEPPPDPSWALIAVLVATAGLCAFVILVLS